MKNRTVIKLHMNVSFLLMMLLEFFDVVLFCLSCCKNSGVISFVRLFIQSMILYMKSLFIVYKSFNELLYKHHSWYVLNAVLKPLSKVRLHVAKIFAVFDEMWFKIKFEAKHLTIIYELVNCSNWYSTLNLKTSNYRKILLFNLWCFFCFFNSFPILSLINRLYEFNQSICSRFRREKSISFGSNGINATGSNPRNCFPPPEATSLSPKK